jgi:hypothetical protein
MPSSSFTASAWIVGGRMRHHRTHDHFGTEPDSAIAISSPIGKGLLGKTVGEVAEIQIPAGKLELKVLEITFE